MPSARTESFFHSLEGYQIEIKKEQNMSSLRNLFIELSENLNKFSSLLFALITATNSMFIKQQVMMLLALTIVLYSLLVIVGTILQMHNRTLLPIIISGMFIVGGAASFLALSIISLSVAVITLVLWVVILALVVYMYVVPQRSSSLLPL